MYTHIRIQLRVCSHIYVYIQTVETHIHTCIHTYIHTVDTHIWIYIYAFIHLRQLRNKGNRRRIATTPTLTPTPTRHAQVVCVTFMRQLMRHPTFLDGYCSTVQGLLDWFEVDLRFTELLFIQIDLCVMCVLSRFFSLYRV